MRWLTGLIPLFVIAHTGHHMMTALPSPLIPLIRSDFNLDYTQSGLVISAFTLAYGIGHLPAGWLSDRFGGRVMVTIGVSGLALGGLLVGLSQTYAMMLVFLALMGALGGSYHPAAPAMVATSVGLDQRGKALGMHGIGGSISHFLAPLIAAAVATAWGWRGSFIVLAIPAAIFGIIFYVYIGQSQAQARAKLVSRPAQTPVAPGHWRRLVMFAILATSVQAVLFSTLSFIPLFLVDHFGIGKEAAAASMSLVFSAGLWASPLSGHLSDRWGRIPVMLAACLLAAPVIYLFNVVPYGLASGAVMIALGVIVYTRMTMTEAFVVDQTSDRNRSTILGITQFTGMESGGVLAPVLGYLIDNYGFTTTFTIAAAAVLVITLAFTPALWGKRDSIKASPRSPGTA